MSGFQGGLPAIGEELARVDVGFGGDSKERIAEVGEGVDAVAFGALDKGVVDGGGAASAVVSQEEPVFAANSDSSQSLFGGVVVDVEIAVVEVADERGPVVQRVVHGFADGTLG